MNYSRSVYLVLLSVWLTPVFGQPPGSGAGEDTSQQQSAPEIPSNQQLLAGLAGDSAARLKSLRYSGWKLWEAPDKFYPAVTACIADSDPVVRRAVVTQIGQFMVWNPGENNQQSAEAIEFLLEHSHDDDPRTRYNCVYYGLSTVREKSDAVIDRLLELMVGPQDPHHNSLSGRVKWGLQSTAARAALRIQAKIDSLDVQDVRGAKMLSILHHQLTDRFPQRLRRFQDDGAAMIVFTTEPAFIAKDAADVENRMRQLCGDAIPVDQLDVGLIQGDYQGVLLISGLHHYAAVMTRIEESEHLRVVFHHDLSLMKQDDRDRTLRQMAKFVREAKPAPDESYEQAFRQLYDQLGRDYAHFELKEIDWDAVGRELLPRSKGLATRSQFCILCQELVARLEDSHAYLFKGKQEPVWMPSPAWDPGFACLLGQQDKLIVYHVDDPSPAKTAGMQVGMTVTAINDTPVQQWMAARMERIRKYSGYSSEQYLRYHVAQWLPRQVKRDTEVSVSVIRVDGKESTFKMLASLGARYLPRLPVPIEGISDSGNVSWKRLDEKTGYVYVRRIRGDLIENLDAAVAELQDCQGLVIDVRGNSGGGFDAERSFRNFDLSDQAEPDRPRYKGPIAVLIDSRCISAGEGWISWFRANDRATFFGQPTAGSSARKKTIQVLDGAYKVIFSVKAYKGFLDRPIERIGIQPDVTVRHKPSDLAAGVDTVLNKAIESFR